MKSTDTTIKIEQEITGIKQQLGQYKKEGKSIFISSSFQSHSIPLLHIISTIDENIPVYFLNTGFHFPETIAFKNQVATRLGIKVIDLESPISKIEQKNTGGKFHFTSKPDHCCYLNKVLPLEPIIAQYDIWISGLRRDQNTHRSGLSKEDDSRSDILKYYPMLEWDKRMIWQYIHQYDLPQHPLYDLAGGSIGCEPCTSFIEFGESRSGRWEGLDKTECGLHT